jgi:hypothetical protein
MPINNALTPEGQNALGAAFGYYPQLRRNRTLQDPRLAAEMPLQFLRGRAAATLGLPSDVANLVRSPMPMEMYGDVDYGPQTQVPYGSQELLRTLPLPPQGAAQQAAANVGAVVPLTPMEALQAARAARQAAFATGRTLGPAAAGMAENLLQRQGLMPGVVPVDVARQIDMPINLPTSKEFMKAIENEPSARITSEGLSMKLRRMQSPEQSGMESVRTGVFYLPEGQAGNLKHYKGKTGYGGVESIEGETLYKNPLFVKGATGGKAPEVAYDQLTGKGAYQSMRKDALSVRHPDLISDKRYNLSDAITPEQFLEKYAPDLKGYGNYIFSNSRQGNQLAYALQEAAVAHKVREAGHDAVLGYGKGRGDKGEFLSEVFDVRESNYPTPQGNFELMPKFQNQLRQAK